MSAEADTGVALADMKRRLEVGSCARGRRVCMCAGTCYPTRMHGDSSCWVAGLVRVVQREVLPYSTSRRGCTEATAAGVARRPLYRTAAHS